MVEYKAGTARCHNVSSFERPSISKPPRPRLLPTLILSRPSPPLPPAPFAAVHDDDDDAPLDDDDDSCASERASHPPALAVACTLCPRPPGNRASEHSQNTCPILCLAHRARLVTLPRAVVGSLSPEQESCQTRDAQAQHRRRTRQRPEQQTKQ